jgi:hypothetical protein
MMNRKWWIIGGTGRGDSASRRSFVVVHALRVGDALSGVKRGPAGHCYAVLSGAAITLTRGSFVGRALAKAAITLTDVNLCSEPVSVRR